MTRRLAPRLRLLEERARRRSDVEQVIDVFFADERLECEEHEGCAIEPETSVHHGGVIRLRWQQG
jgi:hypothetical protein